MSKWVSKGDWLCALQRHSSSVYLSIYLSIYLSTTTLHSTRTHTQLSLPSPTEKLVHRSGILEELAGCPLSCLISRRNR
ncbi:hypothetical protein BO70DRAFT_133616 [Aspergillus heteromorphus CBS 117.55]|uniref:Uncharacterized protein n=1 Tax=Aspergillus heteromorphus CBS 117.55 TaxID=1448321 RepID=A0A317WUN8_9EURO|nr:uncharacterized protein BO70DRAFT_133616 [Aspergillus heteromorphus CBS 117.55]PWY90066.1 hypothetical protein BO70DRAFT_133616 [Aspergillus heteromorphus CBS 117.55]